MGLPDPVKFLLKSIEFNLDNIFSSFGYNIQKKAYNLTPREIRIRAARIRASWDETERICRKHGVLRREAEKLMGWRPPRVRTPDLPRPDLEEDT